MKKIQIKVGFCTLKLNHLPIKQRFISKSHRLLFLCIVALFQTNLCFIKRKSQIIARQHFSLQSSDSRFLENWE